MATQTLLPPLLFTISEIRQNPSCRPRYDESGLWLPPRSLGANYVVNSDTWGKWYYFDGRGTLHALTSPPDWAATSRPYRTSSVYLDGARFWSVPYDTTAFAVGNEQKDDENDQKSDEGQEVYYPDFIYDWEPLRFNRPDDPSRPALVQYPGQDERLHVQNRNQLWVRKLLPRLNRAEVKSSSKNAGGLIGDLSLLLALVAFSAAPGNVEAVLRSTLAVNALPWKDPPVETGEGWEAQRGVIVTIYELPGWRECLQAFENGQYGKIFG